MASDVPGCLEKVDKAVQTSMIGKEDIDEVHEMLAGLEEARMVDGKLCIDLCMAEPEIERAHMPTPAKPEYDRNGFRWLVNSLTSDSGARDTLGPADAYPEYPSEEPPGPKRGLHYTREE